jgi:hypothetical protein
LKLKKSSEKYSFGKGGKKNFKESGLPGPGQYHIPCSIRDVPAFVRNPNPAFDKNFTFI